MENIGLWFGIISPVVLLGGMLVKSGMDKAFIIAKTASLKDEIDRLEKLIVHNDVHNLKQHEEFYKVKEMTNRLEVNMEHFVRAVDEIKDMLNEMRREGFSDRRRKEQ